MLIHEATFTESLADEIDKMGHSTINSAIAAGKTLSAKCTVLTHISNRYKDCVQHVEEDNVMFAFDFLSFAFERSLEYCKHFNSTKLLEEPKDKKTK